MPVFSIVAIAAIPLFQAAVAKLQLQAAVAKYLVHHPADHALADCDPYLVACSRSAAAARQLQAADALHQLQAAVALLQLLAAVAKLQLQAAVAKALALQAAVESSRTSWADSRHAEHALQAAAMWLQAAVAKSLHQAADVATN